MPTFDFLGLLNEDPQLSYYASLFGGGQRLSPMQTSYFGNNFGDVYNRYLGTQGRGLVEAQQRGDSLVGFLNRPQSTFRDFLGQNSFAQMFQDLSPSQRPGGNLASFNPRTQWLTG